MKFQNQDAEHTLLGEILLDSERILPKITDIVGVRDFTDNRYARIYEAFLQLFEQHTAIDVLTLSENLRQRGFLDMVGGGAALTALTNDIVGPQNAVEHAQIIAEMALRRRLDSTADAIKESLKKDDNIDAVLHRAEVSVFNVNKDRIQENSMSLGDILNETLNRMDMVQSGQLKRGIPTGYREMDNILTGFQDSDLIIIAARPAMGKTAYALNIARNVAIKQNVPTLVFSLEMDKAQLVDRLLSMETSIPTDRLRSGIMEQQEVDRVTDVMGRISTAPLYIDDTPSVTIQSLRSRARRENHLHHLGLIIVDYLQLMSGGQKKGRSDQNREQEIAEISRGLKIIARELNVPVVALSQLSRQVEARTPQIPQLSDLRESGSIEQNADIVAFLYRDDYYNLDSPRKNMTDLLIRKHRNGRIGSVEMYFDRGSQLFRGISTGNAVDSTIDNLPPFFV